MNLWLVVLISVPIVVLAVARNENRRSTLRSETIELRVDGFGVRRMLADGREESLTWSELTVVEVVRAKWGPHAASGGVVVLAADATSGALVPLDRLGEEGVVEHLAALPGFDLARFTEAIEAQPPARIRIWDRANPPA